MKNIVLFSSVFAVLVVPALARADYFLWQDSRTGLTASFPDTWAIQNNQTSHDILTVALPSGDDRAVCKISAVPDARFMIYPNRFRSDIQQIHFSKDFWYEQTAKYQNIKVHNFTDGAGLGKAFASTAVITYVTPPDEVPEARAALVSGGQYYDQTYTVECSSAAASYGTYADAFQSFVKSIDMKKAYHELGVGNYRNFLRDWGTLEVQMPNAVSKTIY